jgi:hypothetical protein
VPVVGQKPSEGDWFTARRVAAYVLQGDTYARAVGRVAAEAGAPGYKGEWAIERAVRRVSEYIEANEDPERPDVTLERDVDDYLFDLARVRKADAARDAEQAAAREAAREARKAERKARWRKLFGRADAGQP